MAVTVVLVVLVVAAVAGLSREALIASSSSSWSGSPSLPSAQRSSSQTSTSAGLNITNMSVIVLSGSFQPPSSNSATVNANQTAFTAGAGTTFTVDVNIEYDNCHGNNCPAEITSVFVAPASFTVKAITVMPPNSGAGLPALVSLTSGTRWDCNFIVTITAPSTHHTGSLTLTAQTG
jgi:hypothetical protein